jgi:hypothetical protein
MIKLKKAKRLSGNLSIHTFQLVVQRNGVTVKQWHSTKSFVSPSVGELYSLDGLTNPLPVTRVRHEYVQSGSALRLTLLQRVIVEL